MKLRSSPPLVTLALISSMTSSLSYTALAQQVAAQATAPDDHVELYDTLSGTYVVSKPLKDQYDALVAQLITLRQQIDSGGITGADALREVKALQPKLEQLRRQIEDDKVLVAVATEHKQTEVIEFSLGPQRCLVISSDNIRVVGWEGSTVKCELEKVVLGANQEFDEAEFAAIRVAHTHGKAPQLVGRTAAEAEADEAQYLASEDGQKLTAEQRNNRRKLLESIAAQYAIFSEFQGKEIDTLNIQGLTGEEGNRQISLEMKTVDGESHRSVWKRHARLTVHVPQTTALAIRGGGQLVDVQGVSSALLITSQGSNHRDYNGQYTVRDCRGSVVIDDAPIHVVENITGNVSVMATMDYANSGTQHDGGVLPAGVLRTHYYFPPLSCLCKNIKGDLNVWFQRVDLRIENVTGKLDVRNEFGDTVITTSSPLAAHGHRVVSESGRIEATFRSTVLGELPLYAATQCGTVRTNAPSELLETFNTNSVDDQGVRRSWSGFRRAARDGEYQFFTADRLHAAVTGAAREAGLDVISRSGLIVVHWRK